jgi:RIO kinase 1
LERDMTRDEMADAFESLFRDRLITEILFEVRSGKEATVYCCRGDASTGHDLVAAKLYRQLERRSFRNDSSYQAGRDAILNTRDRRALARKSHHGRDLQFGTWIESEYRTIRMLHELGADVPEAISRSGNVLLMEYFGDESEAAPMLYRIKLERAEAAQFLRQIIDNVTLWLTHHLVHGDLSPYNILHWQGRIVVIDFPQAVDPRVNPNARSLLYRDLENVCGYFERYGIHADANRISNELWNRYKNGVLQ